jgi:hypothetical protein
MDVEYITAVTGRNFLAIAIVGTYTRDASLQPGQPRTDRSVFVGHREMLHKLPCLDPWPSDWKSRKL